MLISLSSPIFKVSLPRRWEGFGGTAGFVVGVFVVTGDAVSSVFVVGVFVVTGDAVSSVAVEPSGNRVDERLLLVGMS